MKNKIWVVEMLNDLNGKWETTVGVGLTEYDANEEKREWKTNNPHDRFCVRKYNAQGEGEMK